MRPSRAAPLLVALLVVALAGAACRGGKGSSTTGSTSRRAASSGGAGQAGTRASLTIGSEVAPPTLDLTSNPAAAIDEVLDYNVYQHLYELDPAGKLIPVLATSYSLSNGRRTYTFTIRKGVRFSNGDPLSASDVVYSLERVISPRSTYPYKDLMSEVRSVRAVGRREVAVTLSHPDWEWLFDLAAYSDGVVLDPKAVGQIASHPVGTGPFAFKSFTPNYSVTLVRNPYYWGHKPQLSEVTWRYFSSADAENTALQSGQLNIIDNEPTPQDVARFKRDPRFQVIDGRTNGKVQLSINDAYGPLRDKLVRQAICYATDKRAIIQAASAGYGVPLGSDSVPGDPYYLDLAGTYPYNPRKARQLLAQAGYPHGFPVTITLPPYNYAQIAGPLIAAELQAVGITATIKNIQWPLWLSQVFAHSDFQLTIVDHAEARDISNYATPGYYWNFAHTAQVAKLLQQGNEAPTRAQWIANYRKVLRLITSQAVNDWLYVLPQLTIAQAGIIGVPKSGLSESFPVQYLRYGGHLPAGVAQQGYSS
jgi:peptide/nickel transport system substrate-binding protein